MKNKIHTTMRKNSKCVLLFFLYLLNVNVLYSQHKVVTLMSDESGTSKTYIARDYILMKPGFQFSTSSSNCTFDAKIDPKLIFPPSEKTYAKPDGTITTDQTAGGVVGSISGSISVSSTGGSNYKIPINCPDGLNGLKPSISLIYNSQGSNGVVGWGWSINGVSAILRTKKTKYFNNEESPIVWDASCPLVLDGERLIPISQSSNDSIEYRTENESFSRIVGKVIQSYGPEYFKIYTKSGLTLTYGNPESLASYSPLYTNVSDGLTLSNIGRSGWNLVEIQDKNLNYIKFEYISSDQTNIGNCIKCISYGANKKNNSTSNIVLKFNYEKRPDEIKAYLSGKVMLQQLRLSNIQTIVNDEIQQTYQLKYFDGNISRLSSCEMLVNGKRLFNPTSFEYGKSDTAETNINISYINKYPDNTTNKNIVGYSVMDCDGDGKNEICDVFYEVTQFGSSLHMDYHYLKDKWQTHNPFPLLRSWVLDAGTMLTGHKYREVNAGLNAQFGDFNGDGGVESTYASVSNRVLNVAIWDRKSEVEIYNKDMAYTDNKAIIVVGNFYGKTISDAIVIINNPTIVNGNYKYDYSIIRGENGASPTTWPNIVPGFVPEHYSFNTTKKITSISKCNFASNILYDDLILRFEDGTYSVLKNTMTNVSCFSGSDQIQLNLNIDTKKDLFKLVDLNQDGFIDIVYQDINNRIKVAYGNGDYTFREDILNISFNVDKSYSIITDITDGSATYGKTTYYDKECDEDDAILFMDINNDGLVDILTGDESLKDYNYIETGKNYNSRTNLWESYTHQITDRIFDRTNWNFFINNGTGFTLQRTEFSTARSYLSCIGDIYGNGQTGWIHFNNSGDLVVTDFGSRLNKNLLVKIVNPVGGVYDIEYKTLADDNSMNGLYDSESSINTTSELISAGFHPFSTSSIPVVSRVDNGLSKTKYMYGTALNSWQHKGFVGFKNLVTTNEKTGISELTYQKPYRRGLLLPSRSESVAGFKVTYNNNQKVALIDTLITSERLTYELDELANRTYTLKLKSKINNDYITNKVLSDYFKYDSYGNNIEKTTNYGGGFIDEVRYHYKPINFWCANYPDTITMTKYCTNIETDGIDTISRKQVREYDYCGNVIAVTADPGDKNSKKLEYSNYNIFGCPVTVKVTSGNIVRSSVNMYSESGRFLVGKVDPFGTEITFDWNETKGILNSTTTKNASSIFRKTTYLYDNLNRLIETVTPEGIHSSAVLQWASVNDPEGAKYYKYTEVSGQSPIYSWFDKYGREIQKDAFGFKGIKTSVRTQYNSNGEAYRISEPFVEEGALQWGVTSQYDRFGRIEKQTTRLGVTKHEYDGSNKTVNSPEGTMYNEFWDNGRVRQSNQNGKSVEYDYYASGLVKKIYPFGSYEEWPNPTQMFYDTQGHRTKLIDPDLGTIESEYNGFDELLWTKQNVHNSEESITTTNNFLDNGLLRSVIRSKSGGDTLSGDSVNYFYDAANNYRLTCVKYMDQNEKKINYGDFDRINSITEKVGSRIYNTKFEYDAFGRKSKYYYPSGYFIENHYDEYGNLIKVTDEKNRILWQVIEANIKGQFTKVNMGLRTMNYTYDDRGFLTSIKADSIINYHYQHNINGNLEYRIDSLLHQRECFLYDKQNRLASWAVTNQNGNISKDTIAYDANGNIKMKSDLGDLTLNYGSNGKPHALTSLSGVPLNFSSDSLNITYTDFQKIATISEGDKSYVLTYGSDDQRQMSIFKINGVTQLTRYYLGDYEEEIDVSGNIRKIHYISAGNGLTAILIQNHGKDSLLYVYSDFQGSLIALADENGHVLERYAYNPWGKRLNPEDWSQKDQRSRWIINRGYTLHEHLDAFGIINMNGRVYDPQTAQFLSPDPFVQEPGNWLNFNRYSYCISNPLKYTDPTGQIFGIDDAIFTAVMMQLGPAIVTSMYSGSEIYDAGGGFWSGFASSFVSSVVASAVSTGGTYAIGQAFGGKGSLLLEIARAGTHAIFSGGMTALQGGKFWAGAGAGFISSLAGSYIKVSPSCLPFITGSLGAVAGGAIGKDWESALFGFQAGFSIGAFNHNVHHDGPNFDNLSNTNGETRYSSLHPLEPGPMPTLDVAQIDFETVKKIGDGAEYFSETSSLTQIGMLEYRKSLPISKKIGNFSRFRTCYRWVGGFTEIAGIASSIAGGINVYNDYSKMKRGDIGLGRFGFRTGSFVSSIIAGEMIGGPIGAICGGLIGGFSTSCEYLYDNFDPALKYINFEISNFENQLMYGLYR